MGHSGKDSRGIPRVREVFRALQSGAIDRRGKAIARGGVGENAGSTTTEGDAVRAYLVQIGRVPLLKASEERAARTIPQSGSTRAGGVPYHRGIVVALWFGMSRTLSATASMNCPLCGQRVAPTADSTCVIAWYDCPHCGHQWSARIRNGLPDMPLTGDAYLDWLPHTHRP